MINKSPPQLMGILNLTPDSFSDGGAYNQIDKALLHVEKMLKEGADIIDLGGESTRPGAQKITQQEELDRVLPVCEAIKKSFETAISIDTSNELLMREAIALNVDMINDVRALQGVNDFSFLKDSDCKICLMHMQGEPHNMQDSPSYENLNENVKQFLKTRVEVCESQGINASRLVVDPGFGFGKTLQHNLTMLNQLEDFQSLGLPILVGTSRKSMIGQVLNKELDQRLFGSIATVVLAVQKGANYVRVHDVAASKDAIDMTWAVLCEGKV
jgi:dihydropteroate synthase